MHTFVSFLELDCFVECFLILFHFILLDNDWCSMLLFFPACEPLLSGINRSTSYYCRAIVRHWLHHETLINIIDRQNFDQYSIRHDFIDAENLSYIIIIADCNWRTRRKVLWLLLWSLSALELRAIEYIPLSNIS